MVWIFIYGMYGFIININPYQYGLLNYNENLETIPEWP